MFGKSPTDRVDDTVDYIGSINAVPGDVRRAAKVMVQLYLAAQFPNTGAKPFKDLSGNMSLGARPSGQAKDPRKAARAVYLLWQAMKWANVQTQIPYADATAVPLANVDILLEFTIYKALAVYDAHNNSHVGNKRILEVVFRQDAIRLLTWNKVLVQGSAAWPAGNDQNVLPFYFEFDPAMDRFTISQMQNPGGYPFSAVSIVATHWTRVPGRTAVPGQATVPEHTAGSFDHIQPVEVAGANIVVTTQFTGCTLCIRDVGAVIYAAHINPGGPSSQPMLTGGGPQVAEQLLGNVVNVVGADFYSRTGGAHLVGGAMTIYGREHSNHPMYPGGYGGPNLQCFTMVGFQVGVGWEMFAQENMIDGSRVNIRRIF